MTKLKAGLLSLGVKGTIGNAITFQERGRVNFARTKPIPAYRQTLLQLYQRWDYEDYAYLWRQQSQAIRDTYRAGGVLFHLTGFQYWMKVMLTSLPDLMARWHLDEKSGAVARDSSKQGNNGVIIGASPATGVINGAYDFDGINDYISCGNDPTLNVLDAFTIEGGVSIGSFALEAGVWRRIITRTIDNNNGYVVAVAGNRIYGSVRVAGAYTFAKNSFNLSLDTFYRFAITWDGLVVKVFIDGIDATAVGAAASLGLAGATLIGARHVFDGRFDGIIDELPIYNRVLDDTTILRHAERRYPV